MYICKEIFFANKLLMMMMTSWPHDVDTDFLFCFVQNFLFCCIIVINSPFASELNKQHRETHSNCKQFSIYVFRKRFIQDSLLIWTKYYRFIGFCPELWYSVEKYSVLDAAIHLPTQGTTYFQTELWNYSSTEYSYFQIRTTKKVHWICYFCLYNIYLGF